MTVAYDQRGVMTGDDGGDDHNSSWRIYLPSSVLSAASGNQCQVVFFWGVGTGASAGILLSYIGKSGGTNNYDFTGDQAQVTWNGGNATQASVLGAHIATSTITGYPAAPVLTVGTITSGTIATGQALVDVESLEGAMLLKSLDAEMLKLTNRLKLIVFGNDKTGQVRLAAVLDNLGKGAGGAAVQNLNLMLGLPETEGLV